MSELPYTDYPVLIHHKTALPYCDGFGKIISMQAFPQFAGYVDHTGIVWPTWHEYAKATREYVDGGWKTPTPVAVRMWLGGDIRCDNCKRWIPGVGTCDLGMANMAPCERFHAIKIGGRK